MRILVAEDEAAIADFINHGLSAEGYAVTVASTGDDALALALSEDFGLVVLDRMLPGRDGIEVLKALRVSKPDLRVIMLTARGYHLEPADTEKSGILRMLSKPFSPRHLLVTVNEVLEQMAAA